METILLIFIIIINIVFIIRRPHWTMIDAREKQMEKYDIQQIDIEEVKYKEFYVIANYYNGVVGNYINIVDNKDKINNFEANSNEDIINEVKIYKIKIPIKI